jgi:hypothetical protein
VRPATVRGTPCHKHLNSLQGATILLESPGSSRRRRLKAGLHLWLRLCRAKPGKWVSQQQQRRSDRRRFRPDAGGFEDSGLARRRSDRHDLDRRHAAAGSPRFRHPPPGLCDGCIGRFGRHEHTARSLSKGCRPKGINKTLCLDAIKTTFASAHICQEPAPNSQPTWDFPRGVRRCRRAPSHLHRVCRARRKKCVHRQYRTDCAFARRRDIRAIRFGIAEG